MEEKPRIVVLDDDEVFAAMVSAALEENYAVAVGRNGCDGLRFCRAGRTDLLITDIGMPELDGLQMLEKFQKDRQLAAIPVIIVTATHFYHRKLSDAKRYPQVRGIICKPSGVEQILTEVQRVLQESCGSGPTAP
ncbi:MAG: response regulator [bacterium]